ncbi:MAG TPA: tetratricopeptide repeat protein [Thermoanaerobaculia bacterium]|nr:tetratricopeptide repeat protein [Thermoanaerobaculia bacterium]
MLDERNRIEELRQAALTNVRLNRLEEAIELYDEALALATDEETRELITINKADAMIALERTGPEVQELARVIMRRRNPRHVCLAAYALQYKHRLEGDFKRALFYGQLALRAAEEAGDLAYKRAVLVDLGNIYEMDSQVEKAIEHFEQALEVLDEGDPQQRLSRGYTLENLGYCKLLQGSTDEGIDLVHRALEYLDDPLGVAEAYIDLCYGYLDRGDLDRARHYGEAGLEAAGDPRQVRNAHYLLGEVAYKAGDTARAEEHFDHLARFYPEFRNLKSLLFALDLRGMVNLKL